jgi:hypothetical protein
MERVIYSKRQKLRDELTTSVALGLGRHSLPNDHWNLSPSGYRACQFLKVALLPTKDQYDVNVNVSRCEKFSSGSNYQMMEGHVSPAIRFTLSGWRSFRSALSSRA